MTANALLFANLVLFLSVPAFSDEQGARSFFEKQAEQARQESLRKAEELQIEEALTEKERLALAALEESRRVEKLRTAQGELRRTLEKEALDRVRSWVSRFPFIHGLPKTNIHLESVERAPCESHRTFSAFGKLSQWNFRLTFLSPSIVMREGFLRVSPNEEERFNSRACIPQKTEEVKPFPMPNARMDIEASFPGLYFHRMSLIAGQDKFTDVDVLTLEGKLLVTNATTYWAKLKRVYRSLDTVLEHGAFLGEMLWKDHDLGDDRFFLVIDGALVKEEAFDQLHPYPLRPTDVWLEKGEERVKHRIFSHYDVVLLPENIWGPILPNIHELRIIAFDTPASEFLQSEFEIRMPLLPAAYEQAHLMH